MRFIWPVTPNISQGFGENPDYYRQFGQVGHNGIDIAAPNGTPVYASADGVINYEGQGVNNGLMGSPAGICIIIDHGDVMTGYAHLSNTVINSGQQVKQGELIGHVGATGAATGPHLHFEFLAKPVQTNNGYYGRVNPAQFNVGVEPQLTLLPFQRISLGGTRYRDAPSTLAPIRETFIDGDTYDFKGYVHGQSIDGNDVWFVGKYSGGYAWSGGFTDKSAHDLPNLTASAPEPAPVTPYTPPAPFIPPYTFTKDLDCVTSVEPAANGNFKSGNFPERPLKAIIHDFGTKGRDTFGSTKNTFKNDASEVSAHFVVSGKEIVQMVSLKDRAFHGGKAGNDFIGIETDPMQDPDTIASVRTLLKALEAKYGYHIELIEHNTIMSTDCGDDVDLANYNILEDKPVKDEPTTPVPVTPAPTPDVPATLPPVEPTPVKPSGQTLEGVLAIAMNVIAVLALFFSSLVLPDGTPAVVAQAVTWVGAVLVNINLAIQRTKLKQTAIEETTKQAAINK
jgi:hypothetical protein